MLDMSDFNAQMAQAESRIQALGQQAQAAQAQAQSAAATAANASSSAASAASTAIGAAASGGGIVGNAANLIEQGGPNLARDIRQASSPDSPGGRGWTLGEDIGASWNLVRNMVGGVGGAARSVASSFTGGFARGVDDSKGEMASAMRNAIDETIKAGKDEAEISSPSQRAARELGSPITEGVGMGIMAGTGAMTNAMVTSLMFAFGAWKAGIGGGTFVGPGLNVVANPGGMLGGGLGGFLGGIGNAIDWENKIGGEPRSPAMASRMLMGQLPMGVRDFGQNLLSGIIGSVVPGFMAGPLSDMLGTMLGTKPILTPQQAMAGATSADQGGFTDYPYGGGSYVFNNTFNMPGNFTDVEREVQSGTLQAMRRLGVF